jgi:hypothetical protein
MLLDGIHSAVFTLKFNFESSSLLEFRALDPSFRWDDGRVWRHSIVRVFASKMVRRVCLRASALLLAL